LIDCGQQSPRVQTPDQEWTTVSDATETTPLSEAELSEQAGTALPAKEVVSILDLNAIST
jgi:hypothetical protein